MQINEIVGKFILYGKWDGFYNGALFSLAVCFAGDFCPFYFIGNLLNSGGYLYAERL